MSEQMLTEKQNITHTSYVLAVKDLKEAQQYYKDVLGFTVDGEFIFREGANFLGYSDFVVEWTRVLN